MSIQRTIFIGRPGIYGNPVKLNRTCPICNGVHTKPRETLPCFRKYASERIKTDQNYREAIELLQYSNIHLWCPGCGIDAKNCHGIVLRELAAKLRFDTLFE